MEGLVMKKATLLRLIYFILFFSILFLNCHFNIKAESTLLFQNDTININKDLLNAAKRGDIVEVQHLLEIGSDINYQDIDGMTALIHACKEYTGTKGTFNQQIGDTIINLRIDHLEIVRLLIAQGANINDTDNYSKTALWYANYIVLPPPFDVIEDYKVLIKVYKGDLIEFLEKNGGNSVNLTDAVFYIAQGDMYINNNQIEKAIDNYTKAIEVSPEDIEAFESRGLAYMKIDSAMDRAIMDFNQVIELNPNYAKGYELRGLLYVANKLEEKGCYDLKHACDLGKCEIFEMVKKRGYCK